MIDRDVYLTIKDRLFRGKSIILTGARQVGKSTLLKKMAADYKEKNIWIIQENTAIHIFGEPTLNRKLT